MSAGRTICSPTADIFNFGLIREMQRITSGRKPLILDN